jgi:hypothetical protein
MTEKIKEIVNQFFNDSYDSWGTYKYKISGIYWVKFQPMMRKDCIRVYLYVELPGYEYCNSKVYMLGNGPLNDDNEGLAMLIGMQYKEIEKMNNSNISIGYDLYKSVLKDNDNLREEIKELKKQAEDWHQKYIEEKMQHTTTGARIVFAKHILSGNRDENVIEHMETYGV